MHHKSPTDFGTRHDRYIQEHIHDPYKTPEKLREPTVCPNCNAVFRDGRWQWVTPLPAHAHRTSCQACHRIHDDYPAGVIHLNGPYAKEHRDELLKLARNCEAAEKQEHPLHRIMAVEIHSDAVMIKTTDIHLPHPIAEAIRDAHQGELNIQYDEGGYFTRIDWRQDS